MDSTVLDWPWVWGNHWFYGIELRESLFALSVFPGILATICWDFSITHDLRLDLLYSSC